MSQERHYQTYHRVLNRAIWQTVIMQDWYGQEEYTLEFASATAVWYYSRMPAVPIRWGLIRDPNGKFETQALLCTDLTADPVQILQWCRLRWQIEVTFEEVRAHLGVEIQRQWSAKAILRTTPALLGLFSIVTLLADQYQKQQPFNLPKTAWYQKSMPTFSNALALVRQKLWQEKTFQISTPEEDMIKVSCALFNTWSDLLCYAA